MRARRWLLAGAGAVYAVFWVGGIYTRLPGAKAQAPGWAAPFFLVLSALIAALSCCDLRAVAIFALGGFVAELVGVHAGLPFGAYTYTAALGPALGGVPLGDCMRVGDFAGMGSRPRLANHATASGCHPDGRRADDGRGLADRPGGIAAARVLAMATRRLLVWRSRNQLRRLVLRFCLTSDRRRKAGANFPRVRGNRRCDAGFLCVGTGDSNARVNRTSPVRHSNKRKHAIR